MPTDRRVVVTGMGAVTPVGSTVGTMWENVIAGRSGVTAIRRFDASGFPTRIGAEVNDLDESRLPADPAIREVLDRKNVFGWVAAAAALDDSGVLASPGRCAGVAIGTESRRPDLLDRLAAGRGYDGRVDHLKHSAFVLGSVLAARYGLTGPQITVSTACTSGTQAIGTAYQLIRWGKADVMLSGGCDSLIDPMMLTGFGLLGALSTRNDAPARASRPFDFHRDGFVLGEGAGMLVLEDRERALARGARIYGEVLGYASSANAYRMTDSPADGRGAYLAMKHALEDARVEPVQIDYVNAHGTSTQQNDRSETMAIKRCFGPHAYRVAVSSTKSMMGHLVNGGGAVELILCLLALGDGVVPPTINYETPDPECDLDYVPNVAREQPVRYALSNSFGFGGINATVVVGREATA